jgi:transcriptional regulator with XRE-family HTH domain
MAQLFGAKLRYLRLQRALTQVALAHQLASQGHITGLETGKEAPSLRLVLQTAWLFGVSTDYLLRDTLPVEPVSTSPRISSDLQPLPQLFGPKLRALRVSHNLTQAVLAQQLGLRRHAYVSNLEAGRKAPSLGLVVQIADLFHVTTDYLLRDDVPIETFDVSNYDNERK